MQDILTLIFTWVINPRTIICLLISVLYLYFTSTFNFWMKRGVPFKKPTILVGNYSDLLLFRKSQCEGIREMYNWFKGARYFGVFRVRSPIFFIRDPELVKNICIKDFRYFVNRGIPSNTDEILDRHLFNFEGEQWKHLRSKLTTVFSSGKIKQMFYLLIECHEVLEKLIKNIALNNSAIDVRELCGKFTIDVIGSCTFGIHINALTDEHSQFHKTAKKLSRPSYKSVMWRMLRTSIPKLYKLFQIQLIDPEITRYFIEIVSQMVKQRESERETKRNDFMDLMIQLKNKANEIDDNDKIITATNDDFDDNMIAAQAFAFFVAGYQPSSNTIAFCLHELALNPEIQRKTRQDIWKAINDNGGNLTYQALQEMTYLEAVVLETLRKYPPAPMTSRRCEYAYEIPGTNITLPAGMRVVIPIYGIHHDPDYYPDPDQFNPNRFMNKSEINRHPYTFIPFGEGPRNCIGMRFAIVQMKVGIVSFLKQHQVDICEKTTVPIKLSRRSLVTSSENGLWLKIKPI